LTLWRCADK